MNNNKNKKQDGLSDLSQQNKNYSPINDKNKIKSIFNTNTVSSNNNPNSQNNNNNESKTATTKTKQTTILSKENQSNLRIENKKVSSFQHQQTQVNKRIQKLALPLPQLKLKLKQHYYLKRDHTNININNVKSKKILNMSNNNDKSSLRMNNISIDKARTNMLKQNQKQKSLKFNYIIQQIQPQTYSHSPLNQKSFKVMQNINQNNISNNINTNNQQNTLSHPLSLSVIRSYSIQPKSMNIRRARKETVMNLYDFRLQNIRLAERLLKIKPSKGLNRNSQYKFFKKQEFYKGLRSNSCQVQSQASISILPRINEIKHRLKSSQSQQNQQQQNDNKNLYSNLHLHLKSQQTRNSSSPYPYPHKNHNENKYKYSRKGEYHTISH